MYEILFLIITFLQFLFIWKIMPWFINICIFPFRESQSDITQLCTNVLFQFFKAFLKCTVWYRLELSQRFLFYVFNSHKTSFCSTFHYWGEEKLQWDISHEYSSCQCHFYDLMSNDLHSRTLKGFNPKIWAFYVNSHTSGVKCLNSRVSSPNSVTHVIPWYST